MLGEYDDVLPGLAERIMKMAEVEQTHRHEQQSLALNVDIANSRERSREITRGQYLGFGCVFLTIAVGAFLVWHGHQTAGTLLSLSGVGGLASAFIWGREGNPK